MADQLMCDHHLCDGPLVCTRQDPHTNGHTYETGSGIANAPKEEA